MDSSMLKKILEIDEVMDSGTLNRDIEGHLNHPVLDSAVLSQVSNSISSLSLTHFESAPQDEHTNYQAQRGQEIADPQEMNLRKKEPVVENNQKATVLDQPSAPATRVKQVPFGMLLPVLLNQLDKDKGMQLQELFGKFKRQEITKEAFVQSLRGVVGEQVLRLSVIAVLSQLASQGSA